MKKFSKILSVALLVALVLSLGITSAFAQEKSAGNGPATITINNAAKGVTYTVYKLFSASLTDAPQSGESEGIAYTGTIPDSLSAYFTKDTAGNITATAAAKDGNNMSAALKTALTAWTTEEGVTSTASAESNGEKLSFIGLDYGYYVVTTSQGDQAITVDSTNPNASIYDKNTTTVNLTKSVDDDNVKIGQTVIYTVTWTAPNFDGAGEDAEQIVEYKIQDTLPAFLTNVKVQSLSVGDTVLVSRDASTDELTVSGGVTGADSFSATTPIVVPWATASGEEPNITYTSNYPSGSTVTLTYSAVVSDQVNTTSDGNENKVTLTWRTTENEKGPKEAKVKIFSYNFGLKKVNEQDEALAGAEFTLPFYVKASDVANVYLYAGTVAGDGLTNKVTTPAGGSVFIKGIATDETTDTETVTNTVFTITETVAPDGYNKLSADFQVTCTPKWEQTITRYYDADGHLVSESVEGGTTETETMPDNVPVAGFDKVVNRKGTELPSTGGIGTTIFYVVGGVLVLAAIILLVTKKRMSE